MRSKAVTWHAMPDTAGVTTVERCFTTDLSARDGGQVRIAGWLHHQRQLSNIAFALVRDAKGIAQVVIDDAGLRERVGAMLPETVIEVSGRAVRTEQAPGGVEIHDPAIHVLAHPSEAPPFELRRPTLSARLPTLLDHAAVAQRHPRRRATARITAASVAGFRSALDALDFTEIHTPKIVGSATETGANVFSVDYFGTPAFLAQSPQFYKQMMVGALERVYEIGPVFRAEPHNTARHLAEYTSLDAELGFIDDHTTVMALLREVLAGMAGAVQDRGAHELELLGVQLPDVPSEIPSVHFADAQRMIETATDQRVAGEPDLAPSHERWIGDWALREHGSDFVFVVGFPMVKRPFYTHPDRARPEFSNSFDLLFRGIELVTGGQRLHRYDDYLAALPGVDLAPLQGYLEAFRHGMPPHGGFAIGLERWVTRIAGADNVREVTLFPRDTTRLAP
jgi:nondiscriminating aspartyl-tRNA synthetase